jgi:hypothetical protein
MRARMTWTVVFVVAVITAACGDSKSSFLPTAPSTLSAGAASADPGTSGGEYGTTANGPKPNNGNGNGNGKRLPASSIDPVSSEKVDFEGIIDAIGESSITVNGRVVTVTTATVIRHGSRQVLFGELRQRDRVHVTANRSGSAMEATEIKVQNPGDGDVAPPPPPPPDPPVVVSVTAVDGTAFEVGGNGGVDTGTFQLTRTGTPTQLAASLAVSFTLGGTAGADDYAPMTATFEATRTMVNVTVTPVVDDVTESPESVVLNLAAGAGYEVGSPATATVTIADVAPPTVNVVALDAEAEEINFNFGSLEISRTGDLSVPLTVTLQFSGTAKYGLPAVLDRDYTLQPMPQTATFTLMFNVNQAVMLVSVRPLDDGFDIPEPSETVVLGAVPGAGYLVGTSGTVTILGR